MDIEDEADALLARIKRVREDLDAGRLSAQQVRCYGRLGQEVERLTRIMDVATDVAAAEAAWSRGADLIRLFLDEHFPIPTWH